MSKDQTKPIKIPKIISDKFKKQPNPLEVKKEQSKIIFRLEIKEPNEKGQVPVKGTMDDNIVKNYPLFLYRLLITYAKQIESAALIQLREEQAEKAKKIQVVSAGALTKLNV